MHEEDDDASLPPVEAMVVAEIPSSTLALVPKPRRDGAGLGRRNQTESFRRMTVGEREEIRRWLPIYEEYAHERPKTRGDCVDVPRPCQWISCRQNLYLDVRGSGPTAGEAIVYNFPDLEPHEMPADRSCALDVADLGGATLHDVAKLTNLTRERIRQVQEKALAKIKRNATNANGRGIDQFVDDLGINKESNKIIGAQRLFDKDPTEVSSVDPEYSENDEHDHDLTLGDGDTLSFFSKHPRTDYFITSRVYRIYMRESVECGFQKRKLTKRQLAGEAELTEETSMQKVSEIDLRVRHNSGMAHRKSKSTPVNKSQITTRQEDVLRAYTDLEVEMERIPNNIAIAKLTGLAVTAVTRDRRVLIGLKLAKPSPRGKTPKAEKKLPAVEKTVEKKIKRQGKAKGKHLGRTPIGSTPSLNMVKMESLPNNVLESLANGPPSITASHVASITVLIRSSIRLLDNERARLTQALNALGG